MKSPPTGSRPRPNSSRSALSGSRQSCCTTAAQVEAFLSILCEDTEIAELELEMGSFQMKVSNSEERCAG